MRMFNPALATLSLLCIGTTAFPRKISPKITDILSNASLASETKHEGTSFNGVRKMMKRQTTFDPSAQLVSTSGTHAWLAPNLAGGDQRGPCPGLNALANHGYLPHNGVADITTIVDGVNTAYGMGLDLANFLAVYGTAFDGNALSTDPGFSIGGPDALDAIIGSVGLIGTPSGLSGSHNHYEVDTSATRGDLYVAGNDYLLQVPQFQAYYDALLDNTPAPEQFQALFSLRQSRFNNSISTNPYFFYPQFAGVFVAPAGYAFPAAMMANHSAQYPQGYLDKETFKSFFAVSGDSGSFTYQAGYERIPNNWYRRPLTDAYTLPDFILDVLSFGEKDARLLSIGGNTGTTNSFVGVSPEDLTSGVFNAATLTQRNNLECFIFQLVQSEAPNLLAHLYEDVTEALQPLVSNIASNLQGLSCPQLESVDTSQYAKYPGYTKAKGEKL